MMQTEVSHAGGFVVRKSSAGESEVLVIKRDHQQEKYFLPNGRIEEGESVFPLHQLRQKAFGMGKQRDYGQEIFLLLDSLEPGRAGNSVSAGGSPFRHRFNLSLIRRYQCEDLPPPTLRHPLLPTPF